MTTTENPSHINLDLGDERGQWIGCRGHVDRYDFMVALADLTGEAEVLVAGPHPQHAYMVRFPGTVDDEEVWWQLDAENTEAESIEPVTVLAIDAPMLTTRRAENPAAVVRAPSTLAEDEGEAWNVVVAEDHA